MKTTIFLCSLLPILTLLGCDNPFYFADPDPDPYTPRGIRHAAGRIEGDVRMLAVDRGEGTPGRQMAQEFCVERLSSLGFTVEKHAYGTGVNVIGVLAGTTEPDKHVLIGAHYDSVDGCVGADDNASGVAGVFEAARALAKHGPHDRTLIAACWDEEERGLVGSIAYVADAKEAGTDFVTTYALEMIGYYSEEPQSQFVPMGFGTLFPNQIDEIEAQQNRGNFIALVTDTPSQPYIEVFETTARRIGLRTVALEFDEQLMKNPLLFAVLRSDHASFWLQGYPATMVTDTANFRNSNYHCPKDRVDSPDDLNYNFAAKVTLATVDSARAALRAR